MSRLGISSAGEFLVIDYCNLYAVASTLWLVSAGSIQLSGHKNRSHCIYCLEIVKGVPNEDFVLSARPGLSVSYAFQLYIAFLFCFWLSVPVQSIVWTDSSLK